ncbi:MAG: hypothetical protein IPK22_28515 [Verrucomicrobiaceae bacterium]|nr:hypothetical protein [Verrucomicrobiaceae bacterium]
MDWIRENKVLSAILGLIALGVAGLGYVLYDAWGSYSAARAEYVALGEQIAQIKSLSLAPTAPNLQAKKALVQEFSTNVNKLGGALFYLQPTVAPAKQAEFQMKLKERVLEIKKVAAEAKIALPAEFSLGFNEYLGTLPNSDATATELSGYLDGIEAVVKLMIACKVRSIDLLDRTPLEMEKDPSKAASSQPKKSLPQRPGATRVNTPAVATISEKRRVSFVVTLDQGSLQNLMSRLANPADMKIAPEADQSHFASLRLLRVENQIKEGPIRRSSAVSVSDEPEIKPLVADKPKTGKEAPSGPVALVPPTPAPVDSVPVIGQELLKAQMDIDLVKFLDAAKGVTTQLNP